MPKTYREDNVLVAARKRIALTFDNFERIYVSFSGGKDSTVMLHMVMDEAKKRNRKVGVLLVDLEGQYEITIGHVAAMFEMYKENADIHWVCLPLLLRNAVTQFEPRWCCWDPDVRESWIREFPYHEAVVKDYERYPFFVPRMEFEEFVVLWGLWYANGKQ